MRMPSIVQGDSVRCIQKAGVDSNQWQGFLPDAVQVVEYVEFASTLDRDMRYARVLPSDRLVYLVNMEVVG